MLDLGRYLLGAAEIAALVGFSWLGAVAVRRRLVPQFSGPPAHLATSILALALLIWWAELLGTFGAFEAVPYLLAVVLTGVALWTLLRRVAGGEGGRGQLDPQRPPHPLTGPAGRGVRLSTLIALLIAAAAVLEFGAEVKLKLGTGMTGFDSTWYHGPFAAGFAQSGDTWNLHYIAPQFLAWLYPANSEVVHAIGIDAFGRDLLSPLLNLGWFIGCLFACWCIGRPYRVAPWSLALGAVALSLPALADQAGEARNDIVGIFFLLAAVAVALNARAGESAADEDGGGRSGALSSPPVGALVVVGLAAGLAAGTKLNFLLPAAVLVLGLVAVAARGRRLEALAAGGLAALAGGGYWYMRNLAHTGNPLPWFDGIGPISLPAPEQALGGREAHSVLGYLSDGTVWSEWFLPGLHHGLGNLWLLLLLASVAGLTLALLSGRRDRVAAVAGLAGLAAAAAWLVAPTSASGPEGMPRGFESGLRYLAPALVLGLALLPTAPILRDRLQHWGKRRLAGAPGARTRPSPVACLLAAALVIAAGYVVQRHYLRDRYASPTFAAPGLNDAFRWAAPLSGARIATTSTRQYPLYGTDLSNRVEFVGEERPHGGFVAPSNCRAWRRLLDRGDYDYVVASRDRVEPGKPPYPPTARWTEGPGATVILRKPPTVVFKLTAPPNPATCPR
jgi:hypothetical protein